MVKPSLPGFSRVGLVVGRKVGGAVERNRAKRRIRHVLTRGAVPVGFDLVVIARREVLTMAFHKLEEELIDALSSAVEASVRS